MDSTELVKQLHEGDLRALARSISLVENDTAEGTFILEHLEINPGCKVIGITGPPGAGKSTLVNALLEYYTKSDQNVRIAVLAIDPTSPFSHGSLLGDRLRMHEHFNNPNIFIRSLATRGALGGLSAKTLEITDVLKAARFDYILVETVGVGQSEVEVAALADTTLVVFVPESGDEIQTLKSGIMEIADIFVVNKADREGADRLVKHLLSSMHEKESHGWRPPVLKTIAIEKKGIDSLIGAIKEHLSLGIKDTRKTDLHFEKVLRLLQNRLVKNLDINTLRSDFESGRSQPGFNVYRFISSRTR